MAYQQSAAHPGGQLNYTNSAYSHGDDEGPIAPLRVVGAWTNVLGALISVALVIGVGVWGYRILVRDVTGIPVVRSSNAPMRIAPSDPGGAPALYQGLSVNKVAASGTAAAPGDVLTLAPRPVELMNEDAPAETLASYTAEMKSTAPAVAEAEPEDVAPTQVAPQTASIRALADQIAAGADLTETEQSAQIEPAAELETAALQTASAAPRRAIKGGIAASLRPRKRPAALPVVQTALSSEATAATSGDLDPDTLPAGTRLAQLGAFESEDIARSEWTRLSQRFSDYLEGKSRVIQKASSGGRTFYRLRAHGFADVNDARRFCSALVAEKADCIPVVTR